MVKHHPDAARREAAQRWCSLVTPVIKAAFTQQAFYGGSECLQEFGDHGYVREWGVEQNVRDARVAMIYERTNEIQAIDLLVRKELPDGGKMFFDWLNTLRTNLDPGQAPDARVLDHLAALEVQTRQLVAVAAHDMTLAHWVADDFLRAVALTLLDWAWLQIGQQAPFTAVQSWAGPAQALQRWVMPELGMRLGIIDTALTGL